MRRLTDILDGVQGLVAAEAARMSLEEEVNQSVSRAVSLAEAAEAAAAAPEDDGHGSDELDLALLAPPAPETVANGSVAPPRGEDDRPAVPGRPGLTSRLGTPAADRSSTRSTGPPLRPAAAPTAPRGPMGRPGTAPPAPLARARAAIGGPQDGPPRCRCRRRHIADGRPRRPVR